MSTLAFDIGGTRLKAGIVSAGHVRASRIEATDNSGRVPSLRAQLVALGRDLLAGSDDVEAVGACVRGIVDESTGVVVDVNPPLECLIGEPLAAFLAEEFAVPARVENDARAYALGELRHGAGRGARDLVCMTLGTGVGVAVAGGGRVLRGGPRGTWGILGGHLTIAFDGPLCTCGNKGCLEALIGAQAIVDDATARLRAGEASELSVGRLDAAAIFAAARTGDPVAGATVDRFVTVLACGIVSLIHAYDPELVVLGGGLTASADLILPTLRGYVARHAWTYPRGRVRIVTAELGDAAALVGAAELARDDAWAWTWDARD